MKDLNETIIQKLSFAQGVKNYYNEILTNEALDFLVHLHEKFNDRKQLLQSRSNSKKYLTMVIFQRFLLKLKKLEKEIG